MTYTEQYLCEAAEIATQLDREAIERVVDYADEWMPLDDEPAQRSR